MIFLILLILFLLAYCGKKYAVALVVLIINLFIPDEIPFVDEVIEIALLSRMAIKELSDSND